MSSSDIILLLSIKPVSYLIQKRMNKTLWKMLSAEKMIRDIWLHYRGGLQTCSFNNNYYASFFLQTRAGANQFRQKFKLCQKKYLEFPQNMFLTIYLYWSISESTSSWITLKNTKVLSKVKSRMTLCMARVWHIFCIYLFSSYYINWSEKIFADDPEDLNQISLIVLKLIQDDPMSEAHVYSTRIQVF